MVDVTGIFGMVINEGVMVVDAFQLEECGEFYPHILFPVLWGSEGWVMQVQYIIGKASVKFLVKVDAVNEGPFIYILAKDDWVVNVEDVIFLQEFRGSNELG